MGKGRYGRAVTLGVLGTIVVVRLFSEVIGVLPRAANFIDVPLLIFLLVYSTAVAQERTEVAAWFKSPALAFAAIWSISVLANMQRTEAAPAFLFLYGFLGPLSFYFLTLRSWIPGGALVASRTLVGLGLLQFIVVGIVQVPLFLSSGDPDVISGTFGENPYQLVFFLIVVGAHVAGIAVFEPRRLTARLVVPFLLATFVVIFLAQYRALVLSTFVAVVIAGFLLSKASTDKAGARATGGRLRAMGVGVVAIAAVFAAFSFAATRFPDLKFLSAIDAFKERPGLLLEAGKVDAAKDILEVYQRDPRYVAIGTGPGTYSSRAWYTFTFFDSTSDSNVAGEYVSKLMGGVTYRTDVSERYVLPQARGQLSVLGSYALTHPFSSYLALAAEVGILGLVVLISIYLAVVRRCFRMASRAVKNFVPGDSLPALAIAAVIAPVTLLQMAVLDNWLEVTRVAAPTWMLIAIVQVEYQHRFSKTSS
jgi:hypothetical protein